MVSICAYRRRLGLDLPHEHGEVRPGGQQHVDPLLLQCVPVLLDDALRTVHYSAGVVAHAELVLYAHLGGELEPLVPLALLVHLAGKAVVR